MATAAIAGGQSATAGYDLIVRQRDLETAAAWTLLDGGAPAVIPGTATVAFRMVTLGLSAVVGGGACTVVDAANGKVSYQWVAPDLNNAGSFGCEFEVTFVDAKTRTYPNDRNLRLLVTQELG